MGSAKHPYGREDGPRGAGGGSPGSSPAHGSR